tara:strand:+ start:19979 stop:21013 length:1035 start_codon:yes stop_codon:yes gene_type:complete
MKTIINVDGGLGRVITAIPALLKYGKNHPEEDWYVMVPGWDFMLWGIEELQQRTFNPETKGMFENYYWDADKVIAPEPYKLPAFYRNEISLAEAFDELINGTTDHGDLPDMSLGLTIDEILGARSFINQAIQGKDGDCNTSGCEPPKPIKNHKKVVVFQPFGSTAQHSELGIYDRSMRSINQNFANKIAKELSKDYIVINMNGREGFSAFTDVINFGTDPDLRTWAAIIQEADYFIGCDSCGQHMAKAVGTSASVYIGGTHEVNVSYPDTFHIIKNDAKYYPNPMRVSSINSTLADKLNEKRAVFSDGEMKKHIKEIIKRIEGGKKVTDAVTVESTEVKSGKGF